MNIKHNDLNYGYTMDAKIKKAQRTQKINRLKRKFRELDFISVLGAALAIAVLIGMSAGFITTLKRPMSPFDTAFTRFLDFVLNTLGGAMAGVGVILIILIIGACFIGIANFISGLRG